MGRPLNKQKYFGNVGLSNVPVPHQIQASVWGPNDGAATAGYLSGQNSSHRFKATTANGASVCTLVNGPNPAAAGQVAVAVYPLGSDPTTYATATANLKVVNVGVTFGGTGTYHVGDVLTLTGGTYANQPKVTVTSVSGGLVTGANVFPAVANQGFVALPANIVAVASSDTTNANGVGATFNVTFGVESVNITSGGAGYGADVALSFPQGLPTWTEPVATGTATLGIVNNSITVSNPGVLNIANPTVVVGSASGTTEYVKNIQSDNVLLTFGGNVYQWLPKGAVPPVDYASPFKLKMAYLNTL